MSTWSSSVIVARRCCLNKKCIPLLGAFTTFVIFVVLQDQARIVTTYAEPTFNKDNSKFISKFSGNYSSFEGNTPTILFWTGFFGSKKSWESFYDSKFYLANRICPSKCNYSLDDHAVNDSDLIIMNSRDLSDFNNTLPAYRNRSQIYMLHNTEPLHLSYLNLELYSNIFNWTSFIRSDSDIPSFYGKRVPKSNQYTSFLSSLNKTKPVVWMASNCITDSEREWYVRELRRHIKVDSYGKCGPLSCPKWFAFQCLQTLQTYYFYLAFENSKCRDYVTEKFWRSLKLGLIPVVMGGYRAHLKVAPPGSFIDSNDFSSPEHLADYLKEVIANQTLYQSYFKWRKHWKVGGNYFCDICEALHHWDGTPQVYHDLRGWAMQDTCTPYSTWYTIHRLLKFIPYYLLYYLGLW